MNDDLEAQFRQIYEEMDYFENPSLAFPKLGGAYLVDVIKGREEVSFLYRSRTVQKASVRAVRPFGPLFFRFGYLVAFMGSRTLVSYRLDLLKDVKLLGSYF